MKKTSLILTLTALFALFSFTPLQAQGGPDHQARQGSGSALGISARDGSLQSVDLSETITVTGLVYDAGNPGSGLAVDEGDGLITTVYGIGSANFWNELGVERPAVGETVAVEAVEIVFSDGSTRLIALAIALDDGTVITLRDEDGKPAWRGGKQHGRQSQAGDCLNPATD